MLLVSAAYVLIIVSYCVPVNYYFALVIKKAPNISAKGL
jgi:hypothetical protein